MEELVMLELLDEEEAVEDVPRAPLPRADTLRRLSNARFKTMFRMSRELFNVVVELVTPFMRPSTRPTDLDIPIRVLTALRFFASGSYQMDVGSNLFMAVSQPTVSRCITEVCDALNNPEIFERFVKFPRNFEELDQLRIQFSRQYDFNGVVGVIDCTHVAIICPTGNDEERPAHIYINRKGYHSLNVQLFADANFRILNVKASYPGSTHDAFIWNNSQVQQVMRTIHAAGHGSYYLLGDSGYRLRPWLMTPLEENQQPNTPGYYYNCTFKRVRSIIECVNGRLKTKFRCLLKHRVLHYTPQKAGRIVNACVVLYNICNELNIPDWNEEDDVDNNDGIFEVAPPNVGVHEANHVDPDLDKDVWFKMDSLRHDLHIDVDNFVYYNVMVRIHTSKESIWVCILGA